MQCRYREKIVYAGDMAFGVVYPAYRKPGTRRGKYRVTSEVQQKLNDRKSRDRLTWLAHANFGKGDYALHLTYSDLPETEEQFEKDIKNYIQRLRRVYRKAGCELKYIYVLEYSETGRAHVHMLVSGGVGRDLLEDTWGKGRANCDRLQFNECGIVDLSRYLLKENRGKGRRRWAGSKNLIRPVEKTNVHTWSRKQVKMVDELPNPHKMFADNYPGYWLAEFPSVYKNGFNGGYYVTFVLYRPDGENLTWYRKKKEGVG